MTLLAPLRAEHFAQFRDETIRAYAGDNVQSLRWPPSGALQRATTEFDQLLPQTIATPGHLLFEIQEAAGAAPVGFAWFALTEAGGVRTGYLYNIQVLPPFRGRGHAREAMAQLEARRGEWGLAAIAMHVFAFNTTAHAMYRALGYGITGFNMIKRFDHGGDPG